MSWVTLCRTDELPDGKAMPVDIDGYKLAVFADAGSYTVLDSTCPHAGKSIAGGWVHDGCAVCPFHNWSFDLTTGEMPGMPGVAIARYPSRVIEHGGNRWIQADLKRY